MPPSRSTLQSLASFQIHFILVKKKNNHNILPLDILKKVYILAVLLKTVLRRDVGNSSMINSLLSVKSNEWQSIEHFWHYWQERAIHCGINKGLHLHLHVKLTMMKSCPSVFPVH